MWDPWIEKFLREKGAYPIPIESAKRHDKLMSVVQGLTYILYMGGGGVLANSEITFKESRLPSSLNFETMVPLMYRILVTRGGSAQNTHGEIMMHNPFVLDVVRECIDQMKRIEGMIVNKQLDELLDYLKLNADSIAYSKEAHIRLYDLSERVVEKVREELAAASTTIEKLVVFKHIGEPNEKLQLGILKSEDVQSVEIEPYIGAESRTKDPKTVAWKQPKTIRFKKDNVYFSYNEKEVFEVRRRKYSKGDADGKHDYSLDISVVFPESVKERFLVEILRLLIRGVTNVEIPRLRSREGLDMPNPFRGAAIGDGRKSVTFRLFFLGDENPELIKSSSRSILQDLGGILR